MIDDFRERSVFVLALAMFLSAGLSKLHATQVSPLAPTIHFEKLTSFVGWHVMEIAKIEQNEAYLFAPGN